MTELNHTDDWQFLDGVEEVTLAPQSAALEPVSQVKALRRREEAPQAKGAQGTVLLDAERAVFHLWTSTLGGLSPTPGDTITDSLGASWTILAVEHVTHAARWKATCVKRA